MLRYILNIIIAIDQLFTALIGGYPDETLSSYAWRMEKKGKLGGRIFRPVIDFLFEWQGFEHGHCYEAVLEEVERRQVPPDLR